MVDFADADALKPFPILQLAAAVLVIILGVYMTLRAFKDNKKDGHLAPQGHDPLGVTVFANSILGLLGTISELIRQLLGEVRELHHEQIKSNSRLAEMKDAHETEMERLRDTVKDSVERIAERKRRDT